MNWEVCIVVTQKQSAGVPTFKQLHLLLAGLNDIFSEAAVERPFYKISVHENHRSIKTYGFYIFMVKIEFLDLFQLICESKGGHLHPPHNKFLLFVLGWQTCLLHNLT